jgi:uncharacterized protein YktB (UPF0637 family)
MSRKIGSNGKWQSDELEIMEMMLNVPTMQEIANVLGRNIKSVTNKLHWMKVETSSVRTSVIKQKELDIEVVSKRERMFCNLRKGQVIITKELVKSSKAIHNLPEKLTILNNNGSCITCKDLKGNIKSITKSEIITKERLIAVINTVEV